MLTLSRQPGEKIVILLEDGQKIELVVREIRRNQVRIKFIAPLSVKVMRLEVAERLAAESAEEAS